MSAADKYRQQQALSALQILDPIDADIDGHPAAAWRSVVDEHDLALISALKMAHSASNVAVLRRPLQAPLQLCGRAVDRSGPRPLQLVFDFEIGVCAFALPSAGADAAALSDIAGPADADDDAAALPSKVASLEDAAASVVVVVTPIRWTTLEAPTRWLTQQKCTTAPSSSAFDSAAVEDVSDVRTKSWLLAERAFALAGGLRASSVMHVHALVGTATDKAPACHLCGEAFGLFRWRQACAACGGRVCAECFVESATTTTTTARASPAAGTSRCCVCAELEVDPQLSARSGAAAAAAAVLQSSSNPSHANNNHNAGPVFPGVSAAERHNICVEMRQHLGIELTFITHLAAAAAARASASLNISTDTASTSSSAGGASVVPEQTRVVEPELVYLLPYMRCLLARQRSARCIDDYCALVRSMKNNIWAADLDDMLNNSVGADGAALESFFSSSSSFSKRSANVQRLVVACAQEGSVFMCEIEQRPSERMLPYAADIAEGKRQGPLPVRSVATASPRTGSSAFVAFSQARLSSAAGATAAFVFERDARPSAAALWLHQHRDVLAADDGGTWLDFHLRSRMSSAFAEAAKDAAAFRRSGVFASATCWPMLRVLASLRETLHEGASVPLHTLPDEQAVCEAVLRLEQRLRAIADAFENSSFLPPRQQQPAAAAPVQSSTAALRIDCWQRELARSFGATGVVDAVSCVCAVFLYTFEGLGVRRLLDACMSREATTAALRQLNPLVPSAAASLAACASQLLARRLAPLRGALAQFAATMPCHAGVVFVHDACGAAGGPLDNTPLANAAARQPSLEEGAPGFELPHFVLATTDGARSEGASQQHRPHLIILSALQCLHISAYSAAADLLPGAVSVAASADAATVGTSRSRKHKKSTSPPDCSRGARVTVDNHHHVLVPAGTFFECTHRVSVHHQAQLSLTAVVARLSASSSAPPSSDHRVQQQQDQQRQHIDAVCLQQVPEIARAALLSERSKRELDENRRIQAAAGAIGLSAGASMQQQDYGRELLHDARSVPSRDPQQRVRDGLEALRCATVMAGSLAPAELLPPMVVLEACPECEVPLSEIVALALDAPSPTALAPLDRSSRSSGGGASHNSSGNSGYADADDFDRPSRYAAAVHSSGNSENAAHSSTAVTLAADAMRFSHGRRWLVVATAGAGSSGTVSPAVFAHSFICNNSGNNGRFGSCRSVLISARSVGVDALFFDEFGLERYLQRKLRFGDAEMRELRRQRLVVCIEDVEQMLLLARRRNSSSPPVLGASLTPRRWPLLVVIFSCPAALVRGGGGGANNAQSVPPFLRTADEDDDFEAPSPTAPPPSVRDITAGRAQRLLYALPPSERDLLALVNDVVPGAELVDHELRLIIRKSFRECVLFASEDEPSFGSSESVLEVRAVLPPPPPLDSPDAAAAADSGPGLTELHVENPPSPAQRFVVHDVSSAQRLGGTSAPAFSSHSSSSGSAVGVAFLDVGHPMQAAGGAVAVGASAAGLGATPRQRTQRDALIRERLCTPTTVLLLAALHSLRLRTLLKQQLLVPQRRGKDASQGSEGRKSASTNSVGIDGGGMSLPHEVPSSTDDVQATVLAEAKDEQMLLRLEANEHWEKIETVADIYERGLYALVAHNIEEWIRTGAATAVGCSNAAKQPEWAAVLDDPERMRAVVNDVLEWSSLVALMMVAKHFEQHASAASHAPSSPWAIQLRTVHFELEDLSVQSLFFVFDTETMARLAPLRIHGPSAESSAPSAYVEFVDRAVQAHLLARSLANCSSARTLAWLRRARVAELVGSSSASRSTTQIFHSLIVNHSTLADLAGSGDVPTVSSDDILQLIATTPDSTALRLPAIVEGSQHHGVVLQSTAGADLLNLDCVSPIIEGFSTLDIGANDAVAIAVLKHCSADASKCRLASLSLAHAGITDEAVRAALLCPSSAATPTIRPLRRLCLATSAVTDVSLLLLSQHLQLPLLALDLSRCSGVGSAAFAALDGQKHLSRLQYLNVAHCHGADDMFIARVARFSRTSLLRLDVSGAGLASQVSDLGVCAVADHCAVLRDFTAQDAPAISSYAFSRLLRACTALWRVDVAGASEVDDAALFHCASTALAHLNVARTAVSDAGLVAVMRRCGPRLCGVVAIGCAGRQTSRAVSSMRRSGGGDSSSQGDGGRSAGRGSDVGSTSSAQPRAPPTPTTLTPTRRAKDVISVIRRQLAATPQQEMWTDSAQLRFAETNERTVYIRRPGRAQISLPPPPPSSPARPVGQNAINDSHITTDGSGAVPNSDDTSEASSVALLRNIVENTDQGGMALVDPVLVDAAQATGLPVTDLALHAAAILCPNLASIDVSLTAATQSGATLLVQRGVRVVV